GNHGRSRAPGAAGHGGVVHLRRDRGTDPPVRPHRGDARAPQGGRTARWQRRWPGAGPDCGAWVMDANDTTTSPAPAAAPSPTRPSLWKRVLAHPLFWPLLALGLLLLGNGVLNPGFLSLEWRDGR